RQVLGSKVTMAGLHEQRFTEEKPLLWGQDTELKNSDTGTFLSAVITDCCQITSRVAIG
uniref:Uncharacterized protein n=1 Tax=Podarcis muralis TaxID=64176 RepID=A0A670HLE7_PODMU